MRTILPINYHWYYKPSFSADDVVCDEQTVKKQYQQVQIPHTNIELPYNYFSDKDFCFTSCYKKYFELGSEYKNKRIFVDFEGVMSAAKVYLNGHLAGEHKGGYTFFSIEITEWVRWNEQNELTVSVDSSESPDTPPFGGQIDYLTFGGIYREVQLRIVNADYIETVFVKTKNVLTDNASAELEIALDNLSHQAYQICAALKDKDTVIAQKQVECAADCKTTTVALEHLQPELWTLQHPKLYTMVCELKLNGVCVDTVCETVGFRQAEFKPDGFFLNGEKIKLRGLNRHQSFPYVGYAMPKRAQQRDAEILKYELGLNLVRTSHYPQSRHFLNHCDKIGLLVFEEIPGWQYIGDEQWKKQAVEDVKQMIVRDRNHPSIILWGVRINESMDDHDLYSKTNETARRLDPTRQTGGVRYLANSEFLEDVYTMNDFIHDNGYGKYLKKVIRDYKTYDNLEGVDGEFTALRQPKAVTGLEKDVPYLVTEYCGHMYPTKRFDQEERVVEHSLRHTRVQNASYQNNNISGAIGWCAFDYNTHSDFGSGDKICYHGVMDAFRVPKFAAYAYSSQVSPKEKIVMEPATYWTRGDRSIGGVIPLIVYTNCDELQVFCGETQLGTYHPNKEMFGALPHPPVVIDKMEGGWGSKWEDAEFVGFVDGKEVVRRKYMANPVPTFFAVCADSKELTVEEDTWDSTRVVVSITDQANNEMPFFSDPISVSVEGAGELIGAELLPTICGKAAFWVKTNGTKGTIQIKVKTPRAQQILTEEIIVK